MFQIRLNSNLLRASAVLIALLLLLSACGKQNEPQSVNGVPPQDPKINDSDTEIEDPKIPFADDDIFDWAKGKEKSSFTGYTVRMNNLQYHEMDNSYDGFDENSDKPWCYRQDIMIEGLKDKKLEEEINIKIISLLNEFTELERIPKVQGIKALQAQGLDPTKFISRSAYAIPYCRMGNILSIAIYSHGYYELDDDSVSLTECETFNIDLNSGKEICMLDLFADDVDGMKYLNNAVDEAILHQSLFDEPFTGYYPDGGNSLALAGRFTGLKEDQKYYLDGSDGSLVLIFDSETPEFHSYEGVSQLRVDITEVAAFDRFIFEGVNIYESDKVVYNLLQRPMKADPDLSIYQEDIEMSGLSGSIWINAEVYEGLNEAQQRFLSVYDEDLVEIQNLLYEKAGNYEKQYGLNSIQAYGSIYSYGFRYGNYISLRRDEYHGMNLKDNWASVYYSDISKERCYKVGRDEPLKIEDIFRNPTNWKDRVAPVIAKGMLNQFGHYASFNPGLMLQMGTDLLDYCTSFSIMGDALHLCYSPPADFIYRYLPPEVEISQGYYFVGNIPFEDIGCEHLNIF